MVTWCELGIGRALAGALYPELGSDLTPLGMIVSTLDYTAVS